MIADTWADVLSADVSANDAPAAELATPPSVPRVLVVGVTSSALVSLTQSLLREGARVWTTTQLAELPILLAGREWAYVMVEHSIAAMVRGELDALGLDTPLEPFTTRALDDWSTHVLPLDADEVLALLARHAA